MLDDLVPEPFEPRDVATLMFIIRRGEVLLMRKRRGLGAGKINAPGGRVEPGETVEEAAIRETIEEVGVHPLAPRLRGELRFGFADGYRLRCHVFTADGAEGTPRTTDEAIPRWTPLDAIPYEEMWADDALWLPKMLAGRAPFLGRYAFDGDRMLDGELTAHDPAAAVFARCDELGIPHSTARHAPVFTVAQAKEVRGDAPGLHTKNLFLRDRRGRMWLVVLDEDRAVDLATLGERLGTKRLSFGSPRRLREHLGVEPGSVTALAAINDPDGRVTVALDVAVAESEAVHCHPLTNDRTTRLSGPDLVRLLRASGHAPIML